MIPLTTQMFMKITDKRKRVNSTELTQNSDFINTTLPPLPNINTPLPRLQRQISVQLKIESVFLNTSTQPILRNNQNIPFTQQFINFVRNINS